MMLLWCATTRDVEDAVPYGLVLVEMQIATLAGSLAMTLWDTTGVQIPTLRSE